MGYVHRRRAVNSWLNVVPMTGIPLFRSRPTRAPQYSGCITTSGRVTSLLQVSVHIRLPIFLYNAFYNEVVGYARVVAERDRQAS